MSKSKVQKLIDKMEAGEPVIGTLPVSYSVEMMEIMAYVGFDFVYVDQMFTTVGWKELADLVRCVQGSDMCVFARPENDPWFGGSDPGVPARVSRALGVGCDGVKVNVYSKDEAAWAIEAGKGWHHRPHIVPFAKPGAQSSTEQFEAFEKDLTVGTLVIPSVESKLGIAQAEEMLDIPGMRAFGIAMTDTAIHLGHPMDYEHPEVWAFIDKIARKAKERKIFLTGGTGYAFNTWDSISGRVKRLHDHGINMIFIQTPEYIFQLAAQELLTKVRAELASGLKR